MKTTVEISDDLYRRAKSEAALRGRKLKETPRQSRHRNLTVLMKSDAESWIPGLPTGRPISNISRPLAAIRVATARLIHQNDAPETACPGGMASSKG